MKAPTTKQADLLRILGSGSIVLTPKRSAWAPLLRRGWVARIGDDGSPKGGWLPPLRITADGYRALAAAVDRDGWPEPPETFEALSALADGAA